MIVVDGLTKRFGSRTAVDGIDLRVERGEMLGLLGPNGAGKTTTLRMLAGLLVPDAGRIEIAGRGAPTNHVVRRSLGVAPQEIALYAGMSAAENVTFFGRMYGLRGRELRQRVDLALELTGLSDRRASRVRELSGGMLRRLNLGCALVHRPEVLLLDEPASGVDPQSRAHLLATLAHLKEEGLAVVYSTHLLEEAERLCDRVAILDHGRVVALDSVPALLAAYGGETVVRGVVDGHPLHVTVDDPRQVLADLLASGRRVSSLHVQPPGLETVFLRLTGRALRD